MAVVRAISVAALAALLSGELASARPEPSGAGAQAPAAAAAPAQASGGVIVGKVTPVEGEPKGEIVVYLEAVNEGATFPPPEGTPKVSQKGAKFEPSLLVVCVGQTVEFLNDEERPIEHNVFSRSETKEFDLGVYKPGGSKSVTFDKPGAVKLFCSIHRYMDGVVYVCPTPYFAVAGADGKYRIGGVAPGEYHVRTWQRKQRFEEAEARVTVGDAPGAEQTIDLALER